MADNPGLDDHEDLSLPTNHSWLSLMASGLTLDHCAYVHGSSVRMRLSGRVRAEPGFVRHSSQPSLSARRLSCGRGRHSACTFVDTPLEPDMVVSLIAMAR